MRRRLGALALIAVAGCAVMEDPRPAARVALPYEDSSADAGGVRLHYLDFGGDGLPVVLVHSEAWDAHTYADFAPRFTDRHRVLAVTRPGYGESEAHPEGYGVATQARSLVDFLDALGIERAVFAGNASATAELTYLGEHHADRVAGLVYFTGLAVPWLEEHDRDPTRAFEMFRRASPGAGGVGAGDAAERARARATYRPQHLRGDGPTIDVPALGFVARSGTMGQERGIGALALVGSPLMADVRRRMPSSPARDHLERLASDARYRDRQLVQISDPEAREYFLRLADDPALQDRVHRYHEEVVLPALREGQERFRRAFGGRLQLVRLAADQVVGYEYRDSPDLIEPHVRRFLTEIGERERLRPRGPIPLDTQDADVPRTPTLPGIAAPAFPYAEPESVGLSSAMLDRLGDEITGWVANGELVGAELLIIKAGRAVFHEAYGWSDREARKPVERNSIWSIKSMSKPFTATAVLMLAEQGKLSLDDPVSRYIPGFAGDDRTTIHHLLSHTSGYRDEDLGDPRADHASLLEWVEEWAAVTPTGTFGEYEYTDFGFAAAGYIVERVTGVPIGPFTEERIVGPLRLGDTSTTFSDDPVWRARLNPWYIWRDEALRYDLRWAADRPAWTFYPAAWGMFSTAMDYAGFVAMWLNRGERDGTRLLSAATVADALRTQGLSSGRGVYGYGWNVEGGVNDDGTPIVFSHGGGDGTLALAFPADDAMVIWLTHSRDGTHTGALRNALAMMEIFDHPGPEFVWAADASVPEVPLSDDERAMYAGVYSGHAQIDWVAHVWQEQGRLHLRLGFPGGRADYWRWHLVPLGNDRFAPGRYGPEGLQAIRPGLQVRFRMDDGQATVLDIVEGDEVLVSTRRDDPDRIRAELEARRSRVSIADVVLEIMDSDGVAAARQRHRALLDSSPDSVRFDEPLLNLLGYRLLRAGRIDEAIAAFEMNVEAHPASPNPHDSLGDAYAAARRLADAQRSYQRAVDLAEQQGHTRGWRPTARTWRQW